MIQIVAWLGAAFALIAAIGMLVVKTPPGKRVQTRLLGLVFIGVAAFNIWLATSAL